MIYTPPPFKLKHDIGKLERVTLSGHSVTPDFNEKQGKHLQINAIRKSCLLARCSKGDNVNKFLVDTGSEKVFMSLKNRPCLRDTDDILIAADGSTFKILGKADVQFSIDGICFCHEFTVAEIDDL